MLFITRSFKCKSFLLWKFDVGLPFVTACDNRSFPSVRCSYDFGFFVHALLQAPTTVQFWPIRQHPQFLLQPFLELHLPRSLFVSLPRIPFGFGILIRGFLGGVSLCNSLFFFSEVADFRCYIVHPEWRVWLR